jgi:hypothetical protein
MRAIHILDGKVINIIEVTSLDSFQPETGYLHADDPAAQIGGLVIDGKFYPNRPSNAEQQEARRKAYEQEADPLYFMVQRGEATQEEWQAKIAEIKARLPYYFDEQGNLIEAQISGDIDTDSV